MKTPPNYILATKVIPGQTYWLNNDARPNHFKVIADSYGVVSDYTDAINRKIKGKHLYIKK